MASQQELVCVVLDEQMESDNEQPDTEPDLEQFRTRKRRSPIWNYFSISASTPSKAVCATCGRHYQHSNNTSNLDKV